MKGTGIFVTKEELSHVQTAVMVSGMLLSGGMPMGDPEWEVQQLCKKYNPPKGYGLDVTTGEFVIE